MAFRYRPALGGYPGVHPHTRQTPYPGLPVRNNRKPRGIGPRVGPETLDSVMSKALEERLLDGLARLLGGSRLRERRLPGLP